MVHRVKRVSPALGSAKELDKKVNLWSLFPHWNNIGIRLVIQCWLANHFPTICQPFQVIGWLAGKLPLMLATIGNVGPTSDCYVGLDMNINLDNRCIRTDLHCKPTGSDKYLHRYSARPQHEKWVSNRVSIWDSDKIPLGRGFCQTQSSDDISFSEKGLPKRPSR